MITALPITDFTVSLDFGTSRIKVGRLILHERTIYFSYDEDFLSSNLNISPLHLPLQPGVTTVTHAPFAGLPGVFADSLPDGWGQLLLDRFLLQQNIHPKEVTALDRLAHVGNTGMGALCYEPKLASGEGATLTS